MLGLPKEIARWGLLFTTLAMSAALIGTGLAGYIGAERTSHSVARSLATGLSVSVGQSIRSLDATDSSAVAEVLSEMQPQGLRYLAIYGADGKFVSSAGSASSPSVFSPAELLPGGAMFQATPDGSRVRITASLGQGPRFGPGFGRGRGPNGPGRRWGLQRAVIEYDASAAQALTNRARTTLIVGSAGAVVLLMVAGVFWQLSRRAELAAGELERDQRLKMLGEMSAVLGHELKNPLASLKGHAQLLLEGIPPGHAARDGAETVVREAVRLEDLAQQVLDFARTGSVERDAEADPVALARAAAEDIGEEQVEVTVLGDPSTWPLDRVRMEQALMNLLRNARQASPEGKKVDLTVAFEEGKRVVYQVRDRGPGLNPGDESQVFEPFYTTRSRGAGLGLVVARRIVQEHGGTLEAQNHPEGGALFRVVIPREIPSGKSRA